MYGVAYRCVYREHWYDDLPPFGDYQTACDVASAVARERRTLARVYGPDGIAIIQFDGTT